MIRSNCCACVCFLLLFSSCEETKPVIFTVNGPIAPDQMGITLPHEHVMVDFIGADSIKPGRYNEEEVFQKALPYLLELKAVGCQTLIECTPAFLGRDVKLLRRLARASGLHLLTNTGYYGATGHKFVPANAFSETAEQLASRWIDEYENGIEGTGIRPGFVKLAADKGPLTDVQKKIIEAGAMTHLATGLTIAVHSGDGAAAREELTILQAKGVAPEAFVWIHAQNEKDSMIFKEIAAKGAWVEFDAISPESIPQHVQLLKFMKANGLLRRTLLSHDAGWYEVGVPEGGNFRRYTTLFTDVLAILRMEGFSETEIDQILRKNPAAAFAVRIRTGHP